MMVRFIVPKVDKKEDHTNIIPFPYNSQDCCRLKYFFGEKSPGGAYSSNVWTRSKCVTPNTRFRLRVNVLYI